MKNSLMRGFKVSATVGCTALLLSGCGLFSSKGSGPQMAELSKFQPTVEVQRLWSYRVGETTTAVLVPAVVGNSVYVAGQEGKLARLDNGNEAWRINTKATLTGGVASDGRLVVVGTKQGEVLAYSAADGSLKWRAQASSEILAPAAITSAGVLVRSGDNTLSLYALADGKREWIYTHNNPTLSLRSNAGPVAADPYAFVGMPGGKVIAVALQNGGLVWEGAVTLPKGTTELERVADVVSAPVVDGPQTCAVAYQGRVACFDVANGGALTWAKELSSTQGLAIDSRALYAADDRSAVYAFDRANGNALWKNNQFMLRRPSTPNVMSRRGLVVVGDVQGYVHFLSRETGNFSARVSTDGSPIQSAPISLGASSVLVQTRDGGIYAFEVQ